MLLVKKVVSHLHKIMLIGFTWTCFLGDKDAFNIKLSKMSVSLSFCSHLCDNSRSQSFYDVFMSATRRPHKMRFIALSLAYKIRHAQVTQHLHAVLKPCVPFQKKMLMLPKTGMRVPLGPPRLRNLCCTVRHFWIKAHCIWCLGLER